MVHHLSKIFLPGLLFSLILCFLPFYGGGTHPTSLFIVHTLLFILMGFLGHRISRGIESSFAVPFLALLFLPFLFYMLVRSCFSPYPFASLLSFWEVFAFFFLFLLTYNFSKNENFIKWLLLSIILSCFLQSVLIQFFSLENGYKQRTAAYFQNPNHLAAFLSMGFFILAPFLLMKRDSLRRPVLLKGTIGAVLVLLLVSLVLERSRGTVISFPVAFLFFLLLLRKRMTSKQLFSILLIVLLIGVLGAFLVYERFEGGKDIYQYERFRIWRASFSIFSDNFLLGVAPGLFEYRAGDYQFPQLQSLIRYGKRFTTPHSDSLLLVTEMGLIGLLLFLIPFLCGMALLIRRDRQDLQEGIRFFGWRFPLKESIFCAALVLFLQGFFDNLTERPAIYMSVAVLLGMLFSRANGKRERAIMLPGVWKSWFLLAVLAVSLIYLYYFAVLSPYVADRIMHKAHQLKSQDKMEKALELCSRALFYNKIHPDFYHFRGEYYLHQIENKGFHPDIFLRAEQDLARASRLNTAKALYRLSRARLYRELFYQRISLKESFEKAQSLYHDAERIKTHDPFIPYECASMNVAAKQYDHALEEIEKSLEVEPYFLQAQLFLAEIYRVTGEEEKAGQSVKDLKKKFVELGRYRVQNRYELKVLDYDRNAYLKICQELGIEP
jgi:O-antigen ligase